MANPTKTVNGVTWTASQIIDGAVEAWTAMDGRCEVRSQGFMNFATVDGKTLETPAGARKWFGTLRTAMAAAVKAARKKEA